MGSPLGMSVLRRKKKSRQDEALEWLTAALKLGAVGAAAKGAKKTASTGAKKGAKKVGAKGGKGAAKRLAPVLAIGGVAVFAAKKLRGGKGTEVPAYDASVNGSPTPATPPSPVAN
jgi:hypothetical protein